MIVFISQLIIGFHLLLLTVLCLFGLHRLSMVWRWYVHRNHVPAEPQTFGSLPKMTVQVPLYNEKLVAVRVVDAMAAFDYPSDLLQIQIVDDSTDDTQTLIADRVAFHQAKGIDIQHVRRADRSGYKAGALKEAMESATGEFIAIFDADFLPEPGLLKENVHHFTDAQLAMVQFRWEHLNRNSSRLTETQAMMLDAHFSLEQFVRNAGQLFFNFNGTGGIWRKQAIYDAGNWSADTLTEDLDLSYRAQLCGWKLLYLNNVSCAGEIPADMAAFKSQQHRWVKGGIEVMLKILTRVWAAPTSIRQKIESTFHLSNNLAYFIMLTDTILLLVPSLWAREQLGLSQLFWLDVPIVILASVSHLIYLVFGQVALGESFLKASLKMPELFILGIRLAVNNARAAGEALLGRQSEFVRTPKSGDKGGLGAIARGYRAVKPKGIGVDLVLAFIYVLVLAWAMINGIWLMLPFLILIIFGFSANVLTGLSSSRPL